MLRRLVAPGCAVSFAMFVACVTDYQKGADDPKYGAPNALAEGKQPGPSSDNVGDGGSSSSSSSAPACVKAGGALVDSGTCSISFKTNILPAFAAANCQTVGTCHGGSNPANQPRIDPNDDPGVIWSGFASFKLSNGKPYIDPCSTNADDSTMACNVDKTATNCGSLMPQASPPTGLPANVVADIKTWLQCGSPNN